MKKALWIGLTALLLTSIPLQIGIASASSLSLITAPDYEGTYSRSAFKHWIDEDKNGCNTRSEVLIRDAIVKPKVGKNCVLIGGKWRSQYDKLVTTNPSALDIDHLVPLAEAWRSGAWAWTDSQRRAFANDLEDSRALVAVSASSNRSKGDKDYSKWQPKLSDGAAPWIGCNYLKAWIAIKMRYQLTMDPNEATWVQVGNTTCAFGNSIRILRFNGFSTTASPIPSPTTMPANLGKQIGADIGSLISGLSTVAKWRNQKVQYLPNHVGLLEFAVEDPPIGFLTEDLNENCVTISISTETPRHFYENSTITVTVRCRWVKAESVEGAGWKWREGKSTTPIELTSCAKLIEVEIEGIKALACAPPENAPNASASPGTTSNAAKRCWVNGYTRSNGTTVKGYYRSC
jgi:hypothetical protein